MPHQLPAFFVGVDWATQKHDVCILQHDGKVLQQLQVTNSGDGLASLAERLLQLADGVTDSVWVAIETPSGPVVDTLCERRFPVFAINPKQLDRFRDRFTVAGAKDDRRDARVLADSLRTDASAFRRVEPTDPQVILLREVKAVYDDLVQEKVAHGNRIREQLRRFFPQMLKITTDVAKPWVLELLEEIPTPQAAKRKRLETVRKLLKKHRITKHDAETVLLTLRETPVVTAEGVVEAASEHIRLAAQRLRIVLVQIRDCEKKMDNIFKQMSPPPTPKDDDAQTEEEPGQPREQRDVEILDSLPGVGRIVLATLLAEASLPLKQRDYHAVRALAGVAPVTRRSGKQLHVSMRYACSAKLRNAMFHWAKNAVQSRPEWKARYKALRDRGHSAARAYRTIADRLLKIAMRMLKDQTTYDKTSIPISEAEAAA